MVRLIKVSDYNHHNMQLAKPVYDRKGRILLGAGNTIHPKYLEKLKEMGISHFLVEDAESNGITLEEMLDMPTWMDAILGLQNVYNQVAARKPLPLAAVQKTIGQLISEVKRRKTVLLVPSTSIASELRPYAHAVNVVLLSLQVGKAMNYNDLQLRDLALGAYLHDIGKAITPEKTKHPEAGFNILRSIHDLSLRSAHVSFQHHETLDGQGYPRGLKGTAIHEYAQICGAANMYENLISLRETPPHEALEALMALSGTKYLESVVKAFVDRIPSYPPGTMVQLNNGEPGIVIRIDTHMQRPVVRILASGQEISLADNPSIMITELARDSLRL